jgi:hypothetical protein
MEKTKYVYKILRKSDGLYSIGGSSPRFKKNGKAWSSIGGLKNHLNLVYGDVSYRGVEPTKVYDDCVVVSYKVVLDTQGCSPDLIIDTKKRMREIYEQNLRWREERKEKEKQLEEYRRKLGL